MQSMNNQRTISNWPRCYAKSHTAQDTFWPILARPHQLHWGVCQENSYCRVLVQPKAEKLRGHAWKTELPFQLGKIVSCHVHIYEKVV